MTVDETLRATLHSIYRLQIDLLRQIQAGTLSFTDARKLLEPPGIVDKEFRLILVSANDSPELYLEWALAGSSANVPSRS